MTAAERKQKLEKILDLLQDSGYTYYKPSGGVATTQMPPPPGTRMNCESAARVFMQLASDMGVDGLDAYYYQGGTNGYFVPAKGKLALGCQPEINTIAAKGWEFDNHWRVKDRTTGVMYDPTFGTSGVNPEGINATDMTTGKNFEMTTVYGKKIQIKRTGVKVECTEISKAPVGAQYIIRDTNFIMKPMTGLRK